MNNITITGRITKDPEIRYTSNNKANVLFTLAVNRDYKDENGERQADFISCVAWGNQAEYIGKYVLKGDNLGINGRLQTRNYQDQNGRTIFITEVIVERVECYTQHNNTQQTKQPQAQQQPTYNTGVKVNGKTYNPTYNPEDEETPF